MKTMAIIIRIVMNHSVELTLHCGSSGSVERSGKWGVRKRKKMRKDKCNIGREDVKIYGKIDGKGRSS